MKMTVAMLLLAVLGAVTPAEPVDNFSDNPLEWQPHPADGATDVPINTLLDWNGPDGGPCDEPCGVINGGFETGQFAPWVAVTGSGNQLTPWNVSRGGTGWFGNALPFEGSFYAQNGFDGAAGLTYDLYQETAIPACAPSAVLTWSDRIQWDMLNYSGSTLPRVYTVTVQPAGGGAALATVYTRHLAPHTKGDTGYVMHSVDLLELAPSIAGKTVRINFHEYIPETSTGPAQFEIDGISLTCGGQTLTAEPLAAPLPSSGPQTPEILSADYEQLRQQALDTAAQERTEFTYGQPEPQDTLSPAPAEVPAAAPSVGQIINGGFETGRFDGWNYFFTGSGSFGINNGAFDPPGPDGPLPPYSGNFSATSQQTGPGVNTLYQDVTLPADADVLTLCWADMIRNHHTSFVDPSQEYRVQIRNLENQILATLFSTNPGDPLLMGWTERTADISAFAGQRVRIAFVEEDTYWYFNVHLDNIRIETEIIPPPQPALYDVYLGTDLSQMELVASDLESSVYNPCLLDYQTTYYWKVIAKNDDEQIESPVWSFTTQSWQPQPADGAADVPVDTLLEWNGPGPSGPCDEPCGVINGGFETGQFTPWVAETGSGSQLTPWNVGTGTNGWFRNGFPFEGTRCAQNGFDGYAGLYYDLWQENAIPACAPSAVLTWSDRIQWDMLNYSGSTLPRVYTVTVQPAGGGAALATVYTRHLAPHTKGDTGYVMHSVDLLELAPSIAGKTVRINFHEFIPETNTGPAQFEIDGISLTCGGQTLAAEPQPAALLSSGPQTPETLAADYEQLHQQALDTAAQERTEFTFDQPEPQDTLSPAQAPAAAPSVGQIVNGDFETERLSSWTLLNSTLTGSFVSNNGAYDPPGPDGPLMPYSGSYSALCQQNAPGTYSIYQDVTLPADVTSLTLCWADMIRNHHTSFVDPSQEYRVQIRNLENQVLATLFSTNPGDLLLRGWTERSADIRAFAGQTVRVAFTVDVQLFYFNVHLDNIRIETENTPPPPPLANVTYDVYFGTDPGNPDAWECIGQDLRSRICDPAPGDDAGLARGRTYYWQIIAKTDCGQIDGPILSFTTENTPPVADAGEDQTLFCWIDGVVHVALDGSESYDQDENPLTCIWTWTLDGRTFSASGLFPAITLPAGVHTITLVVSDGIDDSPPDEVVVAACAPIEVSMQLTPRSLNCQSNGKWLKAHCIMPRGCRASDIDTAAGCTLEPLGIAAVQMVPVVGDDGRLGLEVTFNRQDVCAAQLPLGFYPVTLAGSLMSGHYFYANDGVRIMDNKMEHLLNVAVHWLESGCRKPDWCDGQDINADTVVDLRDLAEIK